MLLAARLHDLPINVEALFPEFLNRVVFVVRDLGFGRGALHLKDLNLSVQPLHVLQGLRLGVILN